MDEDSNVRVPVTRRMRRLSLEQRDDAKSPSTPLTPFKRRGRLAAKPQLDLIDENATVVGSPVQKSKAKEITIPTLEKNVTPARRSTRIKSDTSVIEGLIKKNIVPVTRRMRRLSLEKSDDAKSPSTPLTPLKRRGRLAAKPQLDLIDENATVVGSPVQKSKAKEITVPTSEKKVTPARRSTRIKSNTSEIEDETQTPSKRGTKNSIISDGITPRALRAARRISLAESENETSPKQRTRRTRKSSITSVENQVEANSIDKKGSDIDVQTEKINTTLNNKSFNDPENKNQEKEGSEITENIQSTQKESINTDVSAYDEVASNNIKKIETAPTGTIKSTVYYEDSDSHRGSPMCTFEKENTEDQCVPVVNHDLDIANQDVSHTVSKPDKNNESLPLHMSSNNMNTVSNDQICEPMDIDETLVTKSDESFENDRSSSSSELSEKNGNKTGNDDILTVDKTKLNISTNSMSTESAKEPLQEINQGKINESSHSCKLLSSTSHPLEETGNTYKGTGVITETKDMSSYEIIKNESSNPCNTTKAEIEEVDLSKCNKSSEKSRRKSSLKLLEKSGNENKSIEIKDLFSDGNVGTVKPSQNLEFLSKSVNTPTLENVKSSKKNMSLNELTGTPLNQRNIHRLIKTSTPVISSDSNYREENNCSLKDSSTFTCAPVMSCNASDNNIHNLTKDSDDVLMKTITNTSQQLKGSLTTSNIEEDYIVDKTEYSYEKELSDRNNLSLFSDTGKHSSDKSKSLLEKNKSEHRKSAMSPDTEINNVETDKYESSSLEKKVNRKKSMRSSRSNEHSNMKSESSFEKSTLKSKDTNSEQRNKTIEKLESSTEKSICNESHISPNKKQSKNKKSFSFTDPGEHSNEKPELFEKSQTKCEGIDSSHTAQGNVVADKLETSEKEQSNHKSSLSSSDTDEHNANTESFLKKEKSKRKISNSSSETDEKSMVSFFDDEAEDANMSYQSGDSQDEEDLQNTIENEIIDKGESLHSEESESSEEYSNDSDYEKGSFVVSSDEDDYKLLSGSNDDLTMSDNELNMSKKSKKKFNEQKRKEQKQASREMYESRHRISSKSDDIGSSKTKKSANRYRFISPISSEDEIIKTMKNRRMRLDSEPDSNTSNNSAKSSEISKQLPKEEEIDCVQKNVSISNEKEVSNAVQSSSDESSISENEQIKEGFEFVLNRLNDLASKKIKKRDTSLNIGKPLKKMKHDPIIDQMNLTIISSAKKTKKKIEPLKNKEQEVSSDEIDMKLLFTEDSCDSAKERFDLDSKCTTTASKYFEEKIDSSLTAILNKSENDNIKKNCKNSQSEGLSAENSLILNKTDSSLTTMLDTSTHKNKKKARKSSRSEDPNPENLLFVDETGDISMPLEEKEVSLSSDKKNKKNKIIDFENSVSKGEISMSQEDKDASLSSDKKKKKQKALDFETSVSKDSSLTAMLDTSTDKNKKKARKSSRSEDPNPENLVFVAETGDISMPLEEKEASLLSDKKNKKKKISDFEKSISKDSSLTTMLDTSTDKNKKKARKSSRSEDPNPENLVFVAETGDISMPLEEKEASLLSDKKNKKKKTIDFENSVSKDSSLTTMLDASTDKNKKKALKSSRSEDSNPENLFIVDETGDISMRLEEKEVSLSSAKKNKVLISENSVSKDSSLTTMLDTSTDKNKKKARKSSRSEEDSNIKNLFFVDETAKKHIASANISPKEKNKLKKEISEKKEMLQIQPAELSTVNFYASISDEAKVKSKEKKKQKNVSEQAPVVQTEDIKTGDKNTTTGDAAKIKTKQKNKQKSIVKEIPVVQTDKLKTDDARVKSKEKKKYKTVSEQASDVQTEKIKAAQENKVKLANDSLPSRKRKLNTHSEDSEPEEVKNCENIAKSDMAETPYHVKKSKQPQKKKLKVDSDKNLNTKASHKQNDNTKIASLSTSKKDSIKSKVLQSEPVASSQKEIDVLTKQHGRKRNIREDDNTTTTASKVPKGDLFGNVHIPRLPASVLNKLDDKKPNKNVHKKRTCNVISTSNFTIIEDVPKNKPSNYLEESVYLNNDSPEMKKKTKLKKPKVLPFIPTASISGTGCTTNFKVNIVPKVTSFTADPVVTSNFKNEYLYGKKIKRMRTSELVRRGYNLSKF